MTSAFGAERPLPSNLELLRKAMVQAAEEVLRRCPPEKLDAPVLLVAEDENKANWLVESAFTEEFTRHGFEVLNGRRLEENQTPQAQEELLYKIVELDISYPDCRRRGMFGPEWVTRRGEVSISVQLVSRGRVDWLNDITAFVEDEFPRKRLSWVEDDTYSFTKAELKERDWSRVLEPAIVSTVVGGLLYLFYSNRQ